MVVCDQKLFQCLQLVVIILIVSSRATLERSTRTEVAIRCIEKEREALLKFKDELIDDIGRLSTWESEEDKKDCCNWDGVRCDNLTNHIVELDLGRGFLRGNISVSLLDLRHLKYLDLSFNDFHSIRIPQFIASLNRLRHLDLSFSNFSGEIPLHLGNLSKLHYLDLSTYTYGSGSSFDLLTSTNVDWLSRLHSLRTLNLLQVNLSMATNWLQTLSKLNQLQEVRLIDCHLRMPMVLPPSSFMFNSSVSLRVLDLSDNELASPRILPLLFNSNLSYLTELHLQQNKLQGPIPDAIGNLVSLLHLSLDHNQLEGKVPISLLNLSGLRRLSLQENQLEGEIPISLGNLSRLILLDLSANRFTGMIRESHFFNLSQLRELDFSSNPGISLNFSLGWNPPFQLKRLRLSGCKVGPLFPSWIRSQQKLHTLDISDAEISGTFPDWFWEHSPNLQNLNVSHNNFHGVLHNLSSKLHTIDLSFNRFNGPLPVLANLNIIILSNNEFGGSINKLCSGTDFDWLSLDLSNNLLLGPVPDCLANAALLEYLNLAHNNFSGEIPSLNNGALLSLHLQNNCFTGKIPTSLRNCTSLAFIDLSHNRLTGKIPTWIGDSWNELTLLGLKSNEFFGSLSSNLCRLVRLRVLDLSLNNISGGIPTCLNNFIAMSQVDDDSDQSFSYLDAIFLAWKGIERQYKGRNLELVKLIDLSSNNLEGDVPLEITDLVTLVSLNLSRNNLSGTIPSKIGRLRSLDSLDLSRNHFTGDIPTGISQMDQLGVLDLSYNNLSGKIPQSNHMQTFSDSTFEGNNGLCGIPLRKTCPGDEVAHDPQTRDNADGKKSQEDDDKSIDYGLYISIALGFIIGFWGVCGTLVLNNSWRIAFFELSNKVMDWCHVRIAISKNRLKEAFK